MKAKLPRTSRRHKAALAVTTPGEGQGERQWPQRARLMV